MTIAAAQLEGEGVIVMLLSLALLLGMAKLLGETCRRWGQPQVVGELLAGLILGQSVLGYRLLRIRCRGDDQNLSTKEYSVEFPELIFQN